MIILFNKYLIFHLIKASLLIINLKIKDVEDVFILRLKCLKIVVYAHL